MKNGFKNTINLFVMMTCAIVGVGFISGAEIYEFFARFEKFSIIGIIIFFALNFALTFKILSNSGLKNKYIKMQKNAYYKLKNTLLIKNKIKSIFIFINILLISSAMFSGLFVLAKNLFNNNYLIVMILCLIFVFVILFIGISGLSKVDWFVFVFIVVITVFFVLKIGDQNSVTFANNGSEWAIGGSLGLMASACLFSCLYVFMNIVQIDPLYRESCLQFSKKGAFIFSFCFSSFLTAMLCVFVKFLNVYGNLSDASMPFLKFFAGIGGIPYFVFVVGLFFAILTTLLSCLVGVKGSIFRLIGNKFAFMKVSCKSNNTFSVEKVQSSNESKVAEINHKRNVLKGELLKNMFVTILSLGFSFLLSFIGFHNFVSIVYPIIGVVNFIIFVFL